MHAAPLKSQLKGWVCVLHDITARKLTEEKLQFAAFHDVLTKLPNRAFFIDELERILKREQHKPDYRVALLFLDLDHLKQVNDNFGHHIGDQVLMEFARRIEACIRPGDLVFRLGGDEFAIFLKDVEDKSVAVKVAERVTASLQDLFHINAGEPVKATASIGIAFGGEENTDLDALLRQADGAMYLVKDRGGNGFSLFDD
jgi:diguanylate cyclase (GGDEF)-like protein